MDLNHGELLSGLCNTDGWGFMKGIYLMGIDNLGNMMVISWNFDGLLGSFGYLEW